MRKSIWNTSSVQLTIYFHGYRLNHSRHVHSFFSASHNIQFPQTTDIQPIYTTDFHDYFSLYSSGEKDHTQRDFYYDMAIMISSLHIRADERERKGEGEKEADENLFH